MSIFRVGRLWPPFARYHRGVGVRLLVRVLLFSSAVTFALTALQLYLDYRRDVGAIATAARL